MADGGTRGWDAELVNDTATVTIDRVAAGGDGVARHDGMVVFVPRALPGDVARVELSRQRTFARGRVLELVQASPDREPPRCIHFERDRCGGCRLQGLQYGAQRAVKADIIRDALVRIGKQTVAELEVTGSPAAWYYRNAISLTVQRDRLRPSGWRAGFHVEGDSARVFQLETCHLAMPEVMDGWHAIEQAMEHFPRADSLRATLRLLRAGHLALTVEGGTQWRQSSIEALAAAVPGLRAIWWVRADGQRALRHDARDSQEAGASFSQVNPALAALLREYVIAQVDAVMPATVIDAYCGSGELTAQLLRQGRRVTGIELDPDAAAAASRALQHTADGRILCGPTEQLLAHALPASVVILNPPRAGVDSAVPQRIAMPDSGVARVVYVSCDPATLARDLLRLGSDWQLTAVHGFDMFPQTAHVETVCTIDRRDR